MRASSLDLLYYYPGDSLIVDYDFEALAYIFPKWSDDNQKDKRLYILLEKWQHENYLSNIVSPLKENLLTIKHTNLSSVCDEILLLNKDDYENNSISYDAIHKYIKDVQWIKDHPQHIPTESNVT